MTETHISEQINLSDSISNPINTNMEKPKKTPKPKKIKKSLIEPDTLNEKIEIISINQNTLPIDNLTTTDNKELKIESQLEADAKIINENKDSQKSNNSFLRKNKFKKQKTVIQSKDNSTENIIQNESSNKEITNKQPTHFNKNNHFQKNKNNFKKNTDLHENPYNKATHSFKNHKNNNSFAKNDLDFHKDDSEFLYKYDKKQEPFRELFYNIRRSSFNNNKNYILELNNVLSTYKFEEISTSNMNLFSYSLFFKNEFVFTHLIENYSKHMLANDIENIYFPQTFNKSTLNLKLILNFYQNKKDLSETFIENIIHTFTPYSYIEENNNIILSFIENNINKEQIHNFYSICFSNRNKPLISHSLKFKPFFKYIESNIDKYKSELSKIDMFFDLKYMIKEKKHNMNNNSTNFIELNNSKNTKENNEYISNNHNVYLSDIDDKVKQIQKNEISTTVMIKRKKNMI